MEGRQIGDVRVTVSHTVILSLNLRSMLTGNIQSNMNFVPVAAFMLTRETLSRERTMANMAELLLGGVDTTANAVLWAVYELSRNPEVNLTLNYTAVTGYISMSPLSLIEHRYGMHCHLLLTTFCQLLIIIFIRALLS